MKVVAGLPNSPETVDVPEKNPVLLVVVVGMPNAGLLPNRLPCKAIHRASVSADYITISRERDGYQEWEDEDLVLNRAGLDNRTLQAISLDN